MGFDNRKVSRTADAPSFSAVINEGHNVCTASITYKKGFKVGVPGITARDMDTLMRELTKLDSGCKFYKRGDGSNTMSAKDAATLEALRVDPRTSDAVYRTACASFGVKPQVRNLQAAPSSAPKALQETPSLVESIMGWGDFEQAHAEILRGPFAILNLRIIEQWFKDEPGAQWTAANLATCYKELNTLQCFRTAQTLTRGMNGDLKVVHPYSRARVLALRNQQTSDVANAAPSTLVGVEREAWDAVRSAYPKLAVGSDAFKTCCKDTMVKWAREYALEQNPALAAGNAKGDSAALRQATDNVLRLWARQSNPNMDKNLHSRVWLG